MNKEALRSEFPTKYTNEIAQAKKGLSTQCYYIGLTVATDGCTPLLQYVVQSLADLLQGTNCV